MLDVKLVQTDLQKFNITDAVIAQMKKDYLILKVNDINNTDEVEKVHSARMIVKSKRVEVEKVRKELKADAIKYGNAVDAEAKRIASLLTPIETHLTNEEQKVENEKKRIQEEEARKLKEKIENRQKQLLTCEMKFEIAGYKSPTIYISNEQIQNLPDEEFETIYNQVKAEYNEIVSRRLEAERLAKEESDRLDAQKKAQEKEAARLEAIRIQQEEKEAKLKADKEELDSKKIKDRGYRLFSLGLRWDGEQYKLGDINVHITDITVKSDYEFDALIEKITPVIAKKKEEAEKKRLAEIETAKKEAAEKAKKETEARLKKEAEVKRLAEIKEQKRLAREAALKPDKEKLMSFVATLRGLDLPKLKTKEGKELLSSYISTLNDSLVRFEKKVNEMEKLNG